MKKGFVFIQGNEIPLRFFNADAFGKLEDEYDITYLALRPEHGTKSAGLMDAVKKIDGEVLWIEYDSIRPKKWKELFDVSCIRFKDRSESFAIREEENHKARGEEKYRRLCELAKPENFEAYLKSVDEELGLNKEIVKHAISEKPDFFVIPSTLLDKLTDDVLQVAEAFNIPTILLTAGWDNLSSKGLLHRFPAITGVFGEQTAGHAVTVQGIPKDRVEIVGAPHYESFQPAESLSDKREMQAELGLPCDERKIVLFAGTLRLFDETEALLRLENAVESGEIEPCYFLYRPHPDRVRRENEKPFAEYEWKHVSLDPEMEEYYLAHKRGDDIVPSNYFSRMEYLAKLYKAVDAVISPMSSVLLESIMVGIPAMAVAFGDGKHSWSADKVSRMIHFKELYDIPEMVVCHRSSDFVDHTKKLLINVGNEEVSTELRKKSEFFVLRDERTYGERVIGAVAKALASVTKPPSYQWGKLRNSKIVNGVLRRISKAMSSKQGVET